MDPSARPPRTGELLSTVKFMVQTLAAARDHGVSRGAIRTAVSDLMPDHTAIEQDTLPPELPVTLDMPGKVAGFLRTTELEPAERDALDQGVTVRRGQGYTLRITTAPAVHRQPRFD